MLLILKVFGVENWCHSQAFILGGVQKQLIVRKLWTLHVQWFSHYHWFPVGGPGRDLSSYVIIPIVVGFYHDGLYYQFLSIFRH